MILRNINDEEKLDVSGLNKITVLLDRSESEMSEIGLNEWPPNLFGPPHNHPEKDQVFFIYSGRGMVKLENDRYEVARGDVVYVPSGLVHQTITNEREPLTYVLYNVFNDASNKGGHPTYADHIENVKGIRKQQAEKGLKGIMDLKSEGVINQPKLIRNQVTKVEDKAAEISSEKLLDSDETNRFEFSFLRIPANSEEVVEARNDKEKAFFVVEGRGIITVGKETKQFMPGDLFYMPRDLPFEIETKSEDSKMLSIEINLDTSYDP